ncbi:hypothetical protein ABEF93_001248 [Exophiala dermatitidis]
MTSPAADLSAKLNAPVKKSVFERQKAEAEAKKAREQAETAAVLEDFVKSFDDEGDSSSFPSRRTGHGGSGPMNSNYGPGPGKRHFTSSGLKSGPGSLGPVPSKPRSGPGSLGPGPSYGKKRPYDDFSGGGPRGPERDRRDKNERDRMFSPDTDDTPSNGRRDTTSAAFGRLDEESIRDAEELKAAAKPTLHLSSLPPGTSPAVVKSLFAPSPLTVDNVRILPPSTPGSSTERKSISAIVTLAAETPATDIDTMVSHLQNKYLGFGFYLSISRYLSSAALSGATPTSLVGSSGTKPSANLKNQNLPFGARPVPHQHSSLSRAPPPEHGGRGGRFAPPSSYTSSTPYGSSRSSNAPRTQITVQTPNDLKQLRLIHKTVEALLTFGPEFEALLMSRPEIQRDEQWAWLWDSRSTGGVYYRWKLWEILTNFKSRKHRYAASGYGYNSRPQGDVLFEGQSVWIPPEDNLKFEYVTKVEDLVSDEDYNSSDEEDMDDGGGGGGGLANRYRDHQKVTGITDSGPDNDGMGYLNPLAKTKLVHLLSRLPDSNAKLRKGDVARVTGFAIEHAGAGAEEVAALVTRNVIKPFCYSIKKTEDKSRSRSRSRTGSQTPPAASDDDSKDREGDSENKNRSNAKDNSPSDSSAVDTTPASLVGLYIISDILSSSASAGVRHAWRYRSLFETQLRVQNVFPILGRAARQLNWGKLKEDKWRRSIQSILALWEGWCVFPGPSHDAFVDGFLHPPLTEKELEEKEAREKAEAEEEKRADKEREREKAASRWRTVTVDAEQRDHDSDSRLPQSVSNNNTHSQDHDGDVNMEDTNVDGKPMAEDEEYNDGDDDDDDRPTSDADLDGVPMVDSSDEEQEQEEDGPSSHSHPEGVTPQQHASSLSGEPQPPTTTTTTSTSVQHETPEAVTGASAAASAPERTVEGDDNTVSGTKAYLEVPSSSAASQGSAGRARPRAVDFDDMFE